MRLLDNTRDLLKRHQAGGKSLSAIHLELGDAVNRNWFYKFASGEIKDPSVRKVQDLYDSLKKLRLTN
jgi:hypothetical protein